MLLKRATIIATIVSGATVLITSGIISFVKNENTLKNEHKNIGKGFNL